MKEEKYKYIIIPLISLLIITTISLITSSNISGSLKIIEESETTNFDLIASVPTKKKKSNIVEYLQEKNNNQDVVGLLRVPGTNINEIILQGNDNSFYLNNSIEKKKTLAGSTYLDYRSTFNEGQKNIIYSHNSNTLNLPFHELEKYYDESYYKNHQYIELEDDYGITKYQIFSVYIEATDWSYYNKMNFYNKKDWLNHIEQLKNKSWYNTGVNVNENDQILILQTCSFHENFKNYKNKYLLVIAKRI